MRAIIARSTGSCALAGDDREVRDTPTTAAETSALVVMLTVGSRERYELWRTMTRET
jgi:hypothetical protein